MPYTSNKKPGGLDAATSLAGTNNIVVDQSGNVVRATLNQVEAQMFAAKTQVTPVNGDAVVIRRGSDIRQLLVENMLPAGSVTNAMLGGSIADSKLNTIDTAGKVTNQAVQAVSTNTANRIVTRDGSGNFAAGTITATLSGNASTATTANNVVDGAITDVKVASGAGILGTKISPNFGSQNVVTTGAVRVGTSLTAVPIEARGGTASGPNDILAIGVEHGALGRESRMLFGATFSSGWVGSDFNMRYSGGIGYGSTGGAGSRDLAIKFYTAGGDDTPTERMRITSSANVLIGATTARGVGTSSLPGLQVEAPIPATFVANRNDAVGGILSLGKSRATTAGGTTIVQNNDSYGEIRFAGADGTDLESYGAAIGAAVDGTPGSNDMPGRLVFSTTPDGSASPTERMRIDSAGNVGIGTTSPTTRLHVNGGAFLGPASPEGGDLGFSNVAGTATGAFIDVGPNNEFRLFNAQNTHTALFTNNAERLRITSSGNVGIDRQNPASKLDVNGTVTATAFSGPLTGNVTGNLTGTASAIADSTVTNAKVSSNTNDRIAGTKIAPDFGSQNIITTGSLSAGAATLGAGTKFNRQDTINEGGEIQIARASDNAVGWHIDALGNGNIPALRIFDGHTQTVRLEIGQGGVKATNGVLTTPVAYESNQNAAYLIAGANTWNGATTNWGTFGFQHRIKSNAGGVPRLTIDDNSGEIFTIQGGNVGIGNTNPTTRLVVNGTVTATTFSGTATAISDGAVSTTAKLADGVVTKAKLGFVLEWGTFTPGDSNNIGTGATNGWSITRISTGVYELSKAGVTNNGSVVATVEYGRLLSPSGSLTTSPNRIVSVYRVSDNKFRFSIIGLSGAATDDVASVSFIVLT